MTRSLAAAYQAEGRSQPLQAWAGELGVRPGVLQARLNLGESMDQVVARFRQWLGPWPDAPPLVPIPDQPRPGAGPARWAPPPAPPLRPLVVAPRPLERQVCAVPVPPPPPAEWFPGGCPACMQRAQAYYQMLHLAHGAQPPPPPGRGESGASRPA